MELLINFFTFQISHDPVILNSGILPKLRVNLSSIPNVRHFEVLHLISVLLENIDDLIFF